MNRRYKLQFLVLILILFGVLSYKTYEQYSNIQKTQKILVENETQALSTFIGSFRSTYQDAFVNNHIAITDQTMKLLPVQTINEISKRFSKSLHGDIIIRTVSDRPRNPDNMANTFELSMMEYYRKNSTQKSKFSQHNGSSFFTKALYIKPLCMKCHGNREDAVPSIRDKYDKAYNYKIGDLRGILSIEIKQRNHFGILYNDLKNNVIISVLMFILFSLLIYILVRKISLMEQEYTEKLEAEVAQKTQDIRQQNKELDALVKIEVEKNKQQQQFLFEQSRMAKMGEMISMIAHQWRQPLAAISANSIDLSIKMELEFFEIENKEGRAKAKIYITHALKKIDLLVQNLTSTIDDFRNFHKPNKVKEPCLLSVPIQKGYNILKESLKNDNIEVIEKYSSKEILNIYPNELIQVIINILQNAKDNFILNNIKDTQIIIETFDLKKSSVIRISDNGGGIKDEIINNIFDPYFSTKNEKNGTGLGLYMSKIIVEEHHTGTLKVKNNNSGISFSIELLKED